MEDYLTHELKKEHAAAFMADLCLKRRKRNDFSSNGLITNPSHGVIMTLLSLKDCALSSEKKKPYRRNQKEG